MYMTTLPKARVSRRDNPFECWLTDLIARELPFIRRALAMRSQRMGRLVRRWWKRLIYQRRVRQFGILGVFLGLSVNLLAKFK